MWFSSRYKALPASTPFKRSEQRHFAFAIVVIKNEQGSRLEPSALNDRSGGLVEAT